MPREKRERNRSRSDLSEDGKVLGREREREREKQKNKAVGVTKGTENES